MANIKQISNINIKQNNRMVHTTASLRRDVRQMIKQANQIIYETGESSLTQSNIKYYLKGFHSTAKGGITSDISSERLTKAQAQTLYNRLANFINADTQSYAYKEYESKQFKRTKNKIRKTLRDVYGKRYSDEQINELFAVKEMFPELFDGEDAFYLSVIQGARQQGKKGKSLIDIIAREKYKLEQSGEPYEIGQLKENIIKSARIKSIKP